MEIQRFPDNFLHFKSLFPLLLSNQEQFFLPFFGILSTKIILCFSFAGFNYITCNKLIFSAILMPADKHCLIQDKPDSKQ